MKSTKSYKKEYYKRNRQQSPFDSLEEELREENTWLKDELDTLQGRRFRAELIFNAQAVQKSKLDINQIEECLRYADEIK